MQQAYLVLAGVLVTVAAVTAGGAPWEQAGAGRTALFAFPTEEEWRIDLRLAGAALRDDADPVPLTLRVGGTVLRGLGSDGPSEQAGDLEGIARIADPDVGVVELPVTVHFRAFRADYVDGVAHGWGFTLVLNGDQGLDFDLTGGIAGLQVQHGQGAGLARADGAAGIAGEAHGLELQGSYEERRL